MYPAASAAAWALPAFLRDVRLALGVGEVRHRVGVGVGQARVEVEGHAALQERPRPDHLVALHVVGLVARQHREVHRVADAVALRHRAVGGEPVDLPDRVVDHERGQGLPGTPGRGCTALAGDLVQELHPRRRLLVGELEVGQLGEVGERATPLRASRLADAVGVTDDVRLVDLIHLQRRVVGVRVGGGEDLLEGRMAPGVDDLVGRRGDPDDGEQDREAAHGHQPAPAARAGSCSFSVWADGPSPNP